MRRRVLKIVVVTGAVLAVFAGVGTLRQSLTGADDAGVISSADRAGGEEGAFGEKDAGGDFGNVSDEAVAPVPTAGDGVGGTGDGRHSGAGIAVGGSGSAGSEAYGTDSGIPVAAPPVLGLNDRIIKDGRIEVEVPRGGFDRAYAQVIALAGKVGGTVVRSQTTRQEDQASGEVTIRVPADRFEDLLGSATGVGKILHRGIESSDVSGEFVDLESRLRHLQAQERFYMDLMSKARTVGDAVAINQNLATVQAEKEQVQGRLRMLDEQTTFSRLTVALHEPGVFPLISQVPVAPRGVLAQAWADAVQALQQTVGALLVGAFTLAPLLVLALLGWAAWRRLRPRPAPQDPRPAAVESEGPLPVG